MKHESSKSLKRLNHLISEIDAVYHDPSLRLGISDSVSKILYTICNVGDRCLLSEICIQTGLSKQTVNSALRKLEQEQIIFLTPVDGKAKNVCLTKKGQELANRTALRLISIENDILDSWDEAEVQSYLDLTEKFLRDLKGKVMEL